MTHNSPNYRRSRERRVAEVSTTSALHVPSVLAHIYTLLILMRRGLPVLAIPDSRTNGLNY